MRAASPAIELARLSPAAQRRAWAFAAARRHTLAVRWLKRGLALAMMVGSAGLVVSAIFDPFRVLPSSVTIGDVNLSGTRVTMDLPKLMGFRNDGRPYEVTAKSATQDIRAPGLVDLLDLRADVGMADKSRAQVSAHQGHYDSGKELLNLNSDVVLKSDSGYDVLLQSVDIDFHAGSMISDRPVRVTMRNGSIKADRMAITDNGKHLTFEGNVRSVLLPATADSKADTKAKDTQP